MTAFKQYFWNQLILLDCLLDTTFFGSSPFETISARAYRKQYVSKFWCFMRIQIDWFALKIFKQANHCEKSAQPEVFWKEYEVWK